MERVFDICHGCRRCFNLCDSFPRLFDLIDDGADRRDRRGDQGRLRQGRRGLHPLRHVLHDQVPLRAAARVGRGLSAPDAAPPRRRAAKPTAASSSREQLGETDRNGKLAKPVARPGQLGDRPRQQAGARGRWRRSPASTATPILPRYHSQDRHGPSGRAPAARPGRPGVRPAQGGDLRHLFRRLQQPRRPPTPPLAVLARQGVETRLAYPGLLRHAPARGRRPRRGGGSAARKVAAELAPLDRRRARTSSPSPPAAA